MQDASMEYKRNKLVELELLLEGHRERFLNTLTAPPPVAIPTASMSSQDTENFSIKNVNGSDADQSITFEVNTYSHEIRYYAFEHLDYFCIPAFLADIFNIDDLAYLEIDSGFKFYYFFLKKSPEISLATILQHGLTLVGKVVHKVSVGKDKMLLLNDETCGMRCFLTFEIVGKHKIRSDFVRSSHQTGLASSILFPKFSYVPEETNNAFLNAYGELFENVSLGYSSLVHSDSHSFKEFQKILDPSNSKKDEEKKDKIVLAEIYNATKYLREDYILDKFLEHVGAEYEKGKKEKIASYFTSMISILQSTGYGKSKLVEKLGSRTPTIYTSLQPGKGVPASTFFMSRFIDALDRIVKSGIPRDDEKNLPGVFCFRNNIATAIFIYILRVFFVILKNPKNNDPKKSFNIDYDLSDHPLFGIIPKTSQKNESIFKILFKDLEKLCIYREEIQVIKDKTISLKDEGTIVQNLSLNKFTVDEVYTTDNLEDDVVEMLRRLKNKLGAKDLPSILVIDEAHALKHKIKSGSAKEPYSWSLQSLDPNIGPIIYNRSPYNLFRRCFRIFTTAWEEILLVVISTSGQISSLLPLQSVDPSRRPESSDKYMRTFVLLQTYNVNSSISSTINADMFPMATTVDGPIIDWNAFLGSKFRIVEYFKFGRPLIYATFKQYAESKVTGGSYNLDEPFENCEEFKFYGTKIFGGEKYGITDDTAILFSMFNLAFGTNMLPAFVDKEVLIEKHLMTLVEYFNEHEEGGNHILGNFFPEGPFNFLSARYFSLHNESLKKILSSTVRYGLCSVGSFGELLAQHLLLKIMFTCIDAHLSKVRSLVFGSVPLDIFLIALSGKSAVVAEFLDLNSGLKNSRVSFSFFEYFFENPIQRPFDLMARCLFKGSALTLDGNHRGIDLMIPLVLESGKISFIGIQVKNVQEDDIDSAVVEACEKMIFKRIFYSKLATASKCDRDFCLIILTLGTHKGGVVIMERSSKRQDSPSILHINGMPEGRGQNQNFSPLFDFAPKFGFYRGTDCKYMEKCDRLFDITREFIPQPANSHVEPATGERTEGSNIIEMKDQDPWGIRESEDESDEMNKSVSHDMGDLVEGPSRGSSYDMMEDVAGPSQMSIENNPEISKRKSSVTRMVDETSLMLPKESEEPHIESHDTNSGSNDDIPPSSRTSSRTTSRLRPRKPKNN